MLLNLNWSIACITLQRGSLGFHVLWFRCYEAAAVACHHFECQNSMHSMHGQGHFTMYGLSKEGVIRHRRIITVLNTQCPGGDGKLFCPQELSTTTALCIFSLLS